MENVELSIVMPCLDEAETIADCINDALSFLTQDSVTGEIIIADNGSTDGSIEIAESLGARVINVPIMGYGSACRAGVERARGRYVVMGDSDRSYDFSRLGVFLRELRAGADLVMGNRFKGGIKPGAMPFKNRYLGNPILSSIGKTLFKTRVGDFHCGLRGFSKQAFGKMQLQSPGMEFASEMVMKASLLNLDVREVPTILSPDGRTRPPHLHPWRDGWRHLRLMFLYSPRYLFLIPGGLIMLLGVGMMLRILYFDDGNNRITPGPATLIYSLGMVVVGLQAILFSIAAKIYGSQQGFLPTDSRISWFTKHINSNRLLICGLVLVILSVIGVLISVYNWFKVDFGTLDTMEILSIVIPSTSAGVIGFELILFGLFMGLMTLKKEQ